MVPAVRQLNIGEHCQLIPSLLYSRVPPNGDVTTILPVVTEQVGCVRVATGTAGDDGTAWTINGDNVDVQL